ncbi:MAG TPA: (2Fe-2S)-binding protein [Blastocatellia bacterium]|nr:(2Fe-2S)-binding protein [Blastocatellia bacterium]
MAETISLNINGSRHAVAAVPDRTLLGVLRCELDLTGSKYGCGEGQCGACTVLVNGVAQRSCLTSVQAAVNKTITTIEGLEQNGKLHPLQEAFLEVAAFQCGYCTSGMILSALALLQKNPNPTEAEIVHAMQGNICRCGTFPRIVTAVQKAAQTMKGGRK